MYLTAAKFIHAVNTFSLSISFKLGNLHYMEIVIHHME